MDECKNRDKRALEWGESSKGWKLVPIQATIEMQQAADDAYGDGEFFDGMYIAALAAAPTPPARMQQAVERFPDMRDSSMSLENRIESAIERITSGYAAMRIPVEATDPDVVLQDCLIELSRLKAIPPAQNISPADYKAPRAEDIADLLDDHAINVSHAIDYPYGTRLMQEAAKLIRQLQAPPAQEVEPIYQRRQLGLELLSITKMHLWVDVDWDEYVEDAHEGTCPTRILYLHPSDDKLRKAPGAMVSVTSEDANNYCRILALLGMEEEGDPVSEIERLLMLPPVHHSDDIAVDHFAAAMKEKLAKAREKGRSGWDDPLQCSVEHLQELLHSHLIKGDPVDAGNFAMMLHQRKGSTTSPAQEDKEILQVISERDLYHEWADKLADAIATRLGVDIGEHGNLNNPWQEALDAIEAPAQEIGLSHHFQWCSPGDDQKPKWLLFFEDRDKGFCYFTEESEAIRQFNAAEGHGWNCHLFTLMPRLPAQEVGPVAYVSCDYNSYSIELMPDHENLPDGTKLYTHPADDKLRKAAGEALEVLEYFSVDHRLNSLTMERVETARNGLRAALELK